MLLRSGFVCFYAFVGIAAWWINGYIFSTYEVAQGVNLIYWPHGLRVVLTLLFERYAVIGLIGGSFFVAQLTWPGDPIMHFGAPFVSGSSAYLAQRYILGKSDHAQSRLVGLTPSNLIALGTLSALINAAGHNLLRIGSGTRTPTPTSLHPCWRATYWAPCSFFMRSKPSFGFWTEDHLNRHH